MSFNPNSTIYLCNVPIDNTYKNQIWFSTLLAQREYFAGKVVKTFNDYLTVRSTDSDGALQLKIKVYANIEELRTCNYVYYQNLNHSMKYFYAFITKMFYINENTTELVLETDVYQTWLFDVTLLPSYVVREHSETDNFGDNLVPEKFNFQDFHYTKAFSTDVLNEWGYLVISTGMKGSDGSRGKQMSGIYQGMYFYYFDNENTMNTFLDELEEEEGDCVQSITVIPKFCISGNSIGSNGWVGYSANPAVKRLSFNETDPTNASFEGYTPANNKLYTSPFNNIVVTNHAGDEAIYNYEDFMIEGEIEFSVYGDVSTNPTVTLIPQNYKGLSENFDFGISIGGFPQCAFNSDTYKLWLAKNQFGIALDTAGNIGNIIAGVATTATGAGAGIGAMQAMQGVQGVLGTINSVYQASKEPNRSHVGSAKNNLLTAMRMNKFDFYSRKIKKDYAVMVDDFFTMYGYQTNCIKVPNVSNRPCFNYVQTANISIKGGIPCDDMEKLKSIYNNGITLWKSHVDIGNYSLDNRPTT